uniref:Ubiquitin-like domain-containing protein n=1 Tax=Triticum aestivum TaxID=4565 RepID=A0A3B6LTW2_WHEAT
MADIEIKIAVDRSRNRLLFAEAGSDFVDVLLSFLTLPLSALQSCAPSPGCLSNLCNSVDLLRNSGLLKVEACHGKLLTPAHTDEDCKSASKYCNKAPIAACKCCLVMARVLHVYDHEQVVRKETFVRGTRWFVISDDMTIKPASTRSIQLLPRAFGSDGIGHGFEELEVTVGWSTAFLSSDTILTDAFLSNESDTKAAHGSTMKEQSISQKVLPSNQDSAGSSPQTKIKVFYDTCEKEVVYAECNSEFVDLLLGFLTYPISCVIKHTGARTCHLGRCFSNLYGSVADLASAGCFTGGLPSDTMPELAPYCFHPEIVKEQRYVIGDDLLIYQATATSMMKYWSGRYKDMVMEMDITVGKQEAVALLRAALTSKNALTEVFIDKLEKQSLLQKMQIFAEIPWGKTITLEVTRSDTIATVKSKIKDKASIPAGYRHELVYGSRYLKDLSTVADYNLVKECTITSEIFWK